MERSVAVVANADAGSVKRVGVRELRFRLQAAFAAQGLHADIALVSGRDLIRTIDGFLDTGTETVVAVGGDGTVSTVATRLARSGASLGVVPLGTLNHFAKDLGLPLDIEEAVAAIAAGAVRSVDLGMVNDRWFVNTSTIGAVARAVAQGDQPLRGPLPDRLRGVVRCCREIDRRLRLRLVLSDQRLDLRVPFVLVSNGAYSWAPATFGRRTHLGDGRLMCYFPTRRSVPGLLALAVPALVDRLHASRSLVALPLRSFRIVSPRRRVAMMIDGEPCLMATPLRYRIRRGALRVHVPVAEAACAA